MSLLHMVQKIKNSTDVGEVNRLLSEGWIILEIRRWQNYDSFMLGLLAPETRERIHRVQGIAITTTDLAELQKQLTSHLLSDQKIKSNTVG